MKNLGIFKQSIPPSLFKESIPPLSPSVEKKYFHRFFHAQLLEVNLKLKQ